MTESEWSTAKFGLLLMMVADGKQIDATGTTTWRSVATRVACLALLGSDMPPGVRGWMDEAADWLDAEDRSADSDGLIFEDKGQIYAAFREAYAQAGPVLRQRLAAAQDVFRGSDYYCEEYLVLEADESSPTYTGEAYTTYSAAHCDLIRDIFGNPFRPVTLAPAHRTPTVVSLAQAAYDDRHPARGELDPARLAVLSDALEEAGCDHAEVLGHLRSAGPHVHGCWAVDLCLGLG